MSGASQDNSSSDIVVSLIITALGLGIGYFVSGAFVGSNLSKRIFGESRSQGLRWGIFSSLAFLSYVVWFLVLQSNTERGLGAAEQWWGCFSGAMIGAGVLAIVFDFLFRQWDRVTDGLRVAWGAAWRLALIVVAFWVGNQMLRITEMGIITVILQHDTTFFAEAAEPVGNVNGKGGTAGRIENEIAWRQIERAGSRQDQLNALLEEIDTNYGVEYMPTKIPMMA